MKDERINKYEIMYQEDYDFEKEMVWYRGKFLIEVIKKEKPQKILEIGCGIDLLFERVKEEDYIQEWWVVEPSKNFCINAQSRIQDKRFKILEGFFEDIYKNLKSEYDMIICSSLLHEIKDVTSFIENIKYVANSDTLIHINVPNAYSFHRQLAQEMGYISNVFEKSNRNILLHQYHVFDLESLARIAKGHKLDVIENGGYFIKPFTHKQMIDVMNVLQNRKILDGLYKMGKKYPELASEIYIHCKKEKN